MKNTLHQIREKLISVDTISNEKKEELLSLLDELSAEMGSAVPAEQIDSITGHVKRTADEVTKDEKNPKLIEKAIRDLRDSVTEFEVSHPVLFEKVNNISAMLASMGI